MYPTVIYHFFRDFMHTKGSQHKSEFEKTIKGSLDVIHDQTFSCVIEKILI